MEKQLDNLKAKVAAGKASGEAGPVADRLTKLKQQAGILANTTDHMLKALEGNTAFFFFFFNKLILFQMRELQKKPSEKKLPGPSSNNKQNVILLMYCLKCLS